MDKILEPQKSIDLYDLKFDYTGLYLDDSLILHADCFEWMQRIPENSIHGIVTDPPYGVKEYDFEQLEKRDRGTGGVWRLPPAFDGSLRSPLPRFTALNVKERKKISRFFLEWSKLATRILRPGGHVFIATNTYLSHLVFESLIEGGLEFRGEIIRLVRTFRGGDRPKNAEKEFSNVCSLPRGCYEPWGLFRKPLEKKMRVSDCLRIYQTGGLRRLPNGKPFEDIIPSGRTPKAEREIAQHPSLKPQDYLRRLVYAVLPLGEGIVLDTFMGSGSTIAAGNALGLHCIGLERYADYYELSQSAIPQLTNIPFVSPFDKTRLLNS